MSPIGTSRLQEALPLIQQAAKQIQTWHGATAKPSAWNPPGTLPTPGRLLWEASGGPAASCLVPPPSPAQLQRRVLLDFVRPSGCFLPVLLSVSYLLY